jgi:hypothetical protein
MRSDKGKRKKRACKLETLKHREKCGKRFALELGFGIRCPEKTESMRIQENRREGI